MQNQSTLAESTACRFEVYPFLSSEQRVQYTGWLKDKVLKPVRKLSLVITFLHSESALPDQIADLIS